MQFVILFVLQNKSIFDASYLNSIFTGETGTAMYPKVVSNMLCCVQVVAMGEMLMLGENMPLSIDIKLYA